MAAYNKLSEDLNGKNYFIVSLCMDDVIYESNLNPDKIVTPLGGKRKKQCPDACENAFDRSFPSIRAVGAYSHYSALMQMKAVIVGSKIETIPHTEAIPYGAAAQQTKTLFGRDHYDTSV